MPYEWDFSFLLRFKLAFLKGCFATVAVSALVIIFGTILGIIFAFGKLSKIWILRTLSSMYVNLFLALPVLVLLIWIYYCIPVIFPIIRLSSFSSAVFALSLSLAAFVAEIVIAGMESIPKGQTEAALSLGLTYFQTMRRIVLPQAIRIMLPALLGQYITILKLSSLASIIAVYELLHTANNIISQTYRPLETYTVVALIYLVMIFPLIIFLKKIELQFYRQREEKTLLDLRRSINRQREDKTLFDLRKWEWNS